VRGHSTLVFGLVFLAFPALGLAADWPTAGGGNERLGASPEAATPPFSLVWTYSTEADPANATSPAVVGDAVYFTVAKAVYAVDVATGAQRWRFDNDKPLHSSPTVADGVVYVGDEGGKLHGLAADSGKPLWEAKVGAAVGGAPAVSNGAVAIGVADGTVRAFDAKTGAPRWLTSVGGRILGSVAVELDMVVVVSTDGQMTRLDLATGKVLRQRVVSRATIEMAPVITPRRTYIVTMGGLYALTRSGEPAWHWGNMGDILAPPAVAGGRLYAGTGLGHLICLDAATGATHWEVTENSAFRAAPVVAGDTLIAATDDGRIVAVEADTGKLRWRYQAHSPDAGPDETIPMTVRSQPAYANGSLYVLTNDGNLYRFSAQQQDISPPEVYRMTPAPWSLTDGKLPLRIGAVIVDAGGGVDADSLKMTVDGQPVKAKFHPGTGVFIYEFPALSTAPQLAIGEHTVTVEAVDYRGNRTQERWSFEVDRAQ